MNLNDLQSDPTTAKNIYDTVSKMHGGDKQLSQVILNKISGEEYIESLLPIFIPIVIIAIITEIMVIGCSVQALSRVCCGCCKHDVVDDPYSNP